MTYAVVTIFAWCSALLTISTANCQPELIRIEHIGPEDKPIPSLIISTAPFDAPPTESVVVVSRETYLLVLRELRTSAVKNSTAPVVPEFGTFRISLNEGEERFYFSTRFNAIRFLTGLRDATLEKDRGGQLENHVSYLLSRIE